MDEMRMKVTEVRRVLESGLQQYHDGSLGENNEYSIRASLAIENELKYEKISVVETAFICEMYRLTFCVFKYKQNVILYKHSVPRRLACHDLHS